MPTPNDTGHIEWLHNSPAGQLAKRHGIDIFAEPRVEITLTLTPSDIEYDFKITPELLRAYGGEPETVDEGQFQWTGLLPPVLAAELQWELDEACGWWIDE